MSPIEGICVVCATRNWRICRVSLTVGGSMRGLGPSYSDCEGAFRPEFMYQMHCDTCWEKIIDKRVQTMQDVPDELAEALQEETFDRECVVCGSEFTTDRKGHHLCSDCHHTWLSCSGECSSYFRPYKKRFSESYCYKCRKSRSYVMPDLFTKIAKDLEVDLHFNKKRKFR